jgi:hypothetical protein
MTKKTIYQHFRGDQMFLHMQTQILQNLNSNIFENTTSSLGWEVSVKFRDMYAVHDLNLLINTFICRK